MRTVERLPFSALKTIPQLVKDFLRGEAGSADSLLSSENILRKAEKRHKNFSSDQRELLHTTLTAQLNGLKLSEKQQENLHKLKQSNTVTVTTGHQLNLFTGPVFFIYKILQTIKTAEVLNAESDFHFVPVFWMASEDHDFEEINHFNTENFQFSTEEVSGGAVGRIVITDTSFADKFKKEFEGQPFGPELTALLKTSYQVGRTLAEATKILVQTLFSDYGLLILDGDDARLKQQMTSIFEDELLNSTLFRTTENKRQKLTEKYGKVQVNPREINLFYLTDSRYRIEKNGTLFQVNDTSLKFSAEEILAELAEHPERFSPNAVLRPVYQETVLPNVAYIGGNAEIMYWLELTDYFQQISVELPVLVPRNSMLWLKERTIEKISTSGIPISHFLENFSRHVGELLLAESTLTPLLSQSEKLLQEQFRLLKDKSALTDKTFRNLVEAEEKRQLKSYTRMRKRLLRAERLRNTARVEKLQRLKQQINPGGSWQERVLNFSVFYADHGRKWLNTCYHEIDIYKTELIILEY